MNRANRLVLVFGLVGAVVSTAFAQDAGMQALLDAIKANPRDARAHFNLGAAYFNQQKYDLAAPEFQKCTQIEPNDQQSKEMFESSEGISAYFQRNYSSAVDHLQNTLKVNPQNPNANLLLADSYVQLKKYPEAEAALKSYSLTSPQGKEKASEVLSKMYMDEKRYSEAVTELRNVIEVNPDNFGALHNLGGSYYQLKNFKDAAHFWENAVRIKKDAQTYQLLGSAYYNLGDFNDAIDSYRKSIKLETAKDSKEQDVASLGETHYNLAVAYNDNALYDKAAEEFGEAFKINPKDSNAAVGQAQAIGSAINSHMEKASSFLLNNQYSDAISEWEMVKKYQPDNKQANDFISDAKNKRTEEVAKHDAAGESLKQQGNTLQALNEWNLALQMDPKNEKILKEIKSVKVQRNDRVKSLVAEGDEYYNAKDYTGALASYLKAKEINPKDSSVKSRLKKLKTKKDSEIDTVFKKAKNAYDKTDLKSALKLLKTAKQIDPNNPEINSMLFKVQKDITVRIKDMDQEGVALFEAGNKDKAQLKFQDVLKLNSGDETANDYVKKMTGQQSHEKVNAEQVKALYYDGVNLYINGKIQEAIVKWQECLNQDPGNVNAQKNIEKAQVKLQSIEKLSHN